MTDTRREIMCGTCGRSGGEHGVFNLGHPFWNAEANPRTPPAPLPVLGEKHVKTLVQCAGLLKADHEKYPATSGRRIDRLREIDAHVHAIVAGEVVSRRDVIAKFGASLCEGCEGTGDLPCHGVEGLCGMCNGTGTIEDALSHWLTPQTQEKPK